MCAFAERDASAHAGMQLHASVATPRQAPAARQPAQACKPRHRQPCSAAHVRVVGALAQHKLQQQAVVLVHRAAAVGKRRHLPEERCAGLGQR